MLTVRWDNEALNDLIETLDYIEQHNTVAANKLKINIEKTAESLADMPYRFPNGRVSNTREVVVHPNYIIVYMVSDNYGYVQSKVGSCCFSAMTPSSVISTMVEITSMD